MSTTIQADYTLVSWLEEAESALTSDLFLVSQLDNPEAPESEYVSRKLPYQQLCSLMLQDVGNLASAAASSYIGDLCAVVYNNKDGISAISDLLDDTVSAVIKMANCIQVNKANISAISSFLLHNVEGKDGISVQLPLNLSSSSKLYIGHSGKIAATSTAQMKKFKYDSYGHITGIGDITSADVLALGNMISGSGIGLSVNSINNKVLDLKAATAAELGGVKIDNANASTYNLSILPNGILSAATVDQNIGSIGLSGQLNYLTPSNGYVKQTVFRNDIYICENQADEDKCKNVEFSFKDVFDNWNQGGYHGDNGSRKWYGITDYPIINPDNKVTMSFYNKNYKVPYCIRSLQEMLDYNLNNNLQPQTYDQLVNEVPNEDWKLLQYFYIDPNNANVTSLVQTAACNTFEWHNGGAGALYWVYNNAVSSIIQPMNTHDMSFYYSPYKYDKYELCVDIQSFDKNDDDYNGIVVAFGIDSSGQPEMISLIRQLQPNGYSWYAQYTNVITSYNIDAKFLNPDPSTTWGNAGKTRVYVKRDGNIITAKTSDFSTSDSEIALRDDSLITINLNTLKQENGKSFIGGASVGFINCSQKMSIFKVHKFVMPKTIFRIDTNEWKEISETGSEEIERGRFNERIGIGRFIKNNATNKTFYVDVNSYPKVSELSAYKYELPTASNTNLGGIKLNDSIQNTDRRTYPVKLSADYAYVSVDWKAGDADDAIEKVDELERSFLNNTLTASSTQTISSISQSRGNVTSIGKSTYLYDKIRELSAKVESTESPNNLRFAFDNDTNVLSAKFNGTNTLIDKVQLNPYIISGAQTDTKLDEDGNVIDTGNFLKLIYNDYETRDENSAIYIALSSTEKDNSIGLSGQLNYLTPSNGYVKQTVFRNDIYICENQEDENKSIGSGFTFKEVFDNWQKSGRYNDKIQGYTDYYVNPYSINELFERNGAPDSILNAQPSSYNQLITEIPQPTWYLNVWHWTRPDNINSTTHQLINYAISSKISTDEYTYGFTSQQAYGSEYWVYNSKLCTIIQPMNTWDYACYISPENYTNYEMEVELASHNSDNDYIGIVAAFNTGSDGVPHQLNLLRVGGVNDKGWPSQDEHDNSLCTWYAEVDSTGWPQNNDSAYKTVIGLSVSDDNSSDPTKHKITRNWRDGGKTRIKVRRTGDILEAWTTPFYKDGESIPAYEAKLTIDLASVRTRGGATYTCFSQENGGGKIGFITCSQAMSFYKMISLTLDKQIVRTDTNELKIYHAGTITTQTGKWTDYAGIGRFIKNNATSKTFYVSDASFIKVAQSTAHNNNILFDPSTFELTIDENTYNIGSQPGFDADVKIRILLRDNDAIDLNPTDNRSLYPIKVYSNYNGTYVAPAKTVYWSLGRYLWKSNTTINRPFIATAAFTIAASDEPTYGAGIICDGIQCGIFHQKYLKICPVSSSRGFYCEYKYLGYFKGESGLFGIASENKGFEDTNGIDAIEFYIKYV